MIRSSGRGGAGRRGTAEHLDDGARAVFGLLKALLAPGAGEEVVGEPLDWPVDHLAAQEGGQFGVGWTGAIRHGVRSRKAGTGIFPEEGSAVNSLQ
jgi:hypothetical protein